MVLLEKVGEKFTLGTGYVCGIIKLRYNQTDFVLVKMSDCVL